MLPLSLMADFFFFGVVCAWPEIQINEASPTLFLTSF